MIMVLLALTAQNLIMELSDACVTRILAAFV